MAYRILSLDGGGSWALIQARALGKLYGEQTSGWEILARFQLVAANSGGSLVAGCLAVGMSPADIVASFEDEGWRRLLFHALPWPERHLNPLAWAIGGPRYDTEAKLAGLRKRLGESGDLPLDRLAEAQGRPLPDLLITAFDYDRARALYFRSRPDSRAANFPPSPAPTLAEALHASSTAPVKYFDRPAEVLHRRAWDGGLAGLNNPVLAAVTEAVANGEAPEGPAVLSLGTGSGVLPPVPPSLPVEIQRIGSPRRMGRVVHRHCLLVPFEPGDHLAHCGV